MKCPCPNFWVGVKKIVLHLHQKKITMTTKLTVREIRRVLFETDKYTVIGADEMTNKESRDFLFAKDDQEETFNVIDNDTHLLIWKKNN
jgi:hypothetical protein